VWPARGDRPAGPVGEDGLLAGAAGVDVVVVDVCVVSVAEQDQVRDLGFAAVLVCDEVVCGKLARGGAARVLAVIRALVQRA
jgi:hypothetical protein